jgi:3-dehydroquinate synthase
VDNDPFEKGVRKFLNYGHTAGHAIETYCLNTNSRKDLSHGHSIALGMIVEGYLSTVIHSFNKKLNKEINQFILINFEKIIFTDKEIEKIIKLMKFDKKNKDGQINFVLLKGIGEPILDQQVSIKTIKKSFKFLNEFS